MSKVVARGGHQRRLCKEVAEVAEVVARYLVDQHSGGPYTYLLSFVQFLSSTQPYIG
jgi:hypothetical protein